MVGYAFAAQHPARVARFVIMDAPVPGVGPWEEILKNPLLWHFRFGGPDMERHLAAMQEFADAGVDELYIQQIGGPGDEFFSTYAREVLERFSAAEYTS